MLCLCFELLVVSKSPPLLYLIFYASDHSSDYGKHAENDLETIGLGVVKIQHDTV